MGANPVSDALERPPGKYAPRYVLASLGAGDIAKLGVACWSLSAIAMALTLVAIVLVYRLNAQQFGKAKTSCAVLLLNLFFGHINLPIRKKSDPCRSKRCSPKNSPLLSRIKSKS